MNPARLIQLYDARFSGVRSGHRPETFRSGPQDPLIPGGRTRYVDLSPREDDTDGSLLAAYFLGGE